MSNRNFQRVTGWVGNAIAALALLAILGGGFYIVYQVADRFWAWTTPR